MDESAQKKVFEFQMLQGHLQELQKREEIVGQRLTELARTRFALEELKSVKPDSNAMIPMGGDNFVPGKITDTKNILVSIGGGVAIKKSVEAAVEVMTDRIKELEDVADKITAEAQTTVSHLVKLQSELEQSRHE